MAKTEVNAVFVYGTLKRGECRESCWPRAPLRVEAAATKGQLYDLGPYPALCPGAGTVAGEVWTFAPRDMPATRAALDEIEDHYGEPDDAYTRRVVDCRLAAGGPGEHKTIRAYAYFYSRATEDLSSARQLSAGPDGTVSWSAKP